MGLEHLYERIITVALGALLGVCALLATAKFVRSRARLLSLLVRAQGALFAVLMGAVAGISIIIASVKPENAPTNMVGRAAPSAPQEPVNGAPLRRPGGWPPYRPVGSRVPRDRRITDENIADGYRVAETRESCEIVGRDAFDAPQIHALWLARGGYRDKTRIAPYGWSFPWRDGILDGITVLSRGELRPNIRTLYFPQPFDVPLAMVPSFNWRLLPGGVSNVFWHAVSPSNSLVVTWENSPVNCDVNSLTNFQAELFADGSFVYRYDDHTIAYSRVHPLDLDFDGLPNVIDIVPETPLVASAWNQSDAWAAAAFPSNAAEIASAGGYAAWATRRASDPNRRLVGLQIASPGGRWPICVEVGGVPVMADGRAELLYALDCGAQVPFSLSDGGLGAVAVSCAPPDFQAVTHSDFQAASFPHEWSVGDVVVHLDTPRTGWLRRVAEVSVETSNLMHLHPGDTAQLAAVVTNCHADAYLGCTWHGGAGISFSDAHSLTTTVAYASSSQVQWATNNAFLVTSYAGGYCVTNANWFTVGMEDEPSVEFSLACPDILFLNDLNNGNRTERVYRVSCRLFGPHGTTGQVSIASTSGAELKMFHDEALHVLVEKPIQISIPEGGTYEVTTNLYLVGTTLGNGMLRADAVLDGRETRCSSASCRVIEPLRRLVTTEEVTGCGRFVNPSRLVYGTNAVLKVGVNTGTASFLPEEVKWHVVSGPGEVSPTNGLHTVLTPTADSGTIVVEARFSDDAIQPRFELPIVRPMTINVRAFVVNPPKVENLVQNTDGLYSPWPKGYVETCLATANKVFSQVGVKFTLVGIEHGVGSTEDWIVRETDTETDADGRRYRVISSQARNLFSYSSTNTPEIAIFFVGDIISRKNATAFNHHKWIVVGRKASEVAPAHELGHVLGLDDCYILTAAGELIENGNMPVKRGDFSTSGQDWWRESGRGFYSIADDLESLAEQMLMYGEDTGHGRDIPGQWFKSLRRDTIFEEDTVQAPVGAEYIKRNPEEVYRR